MTTIRMPRLAALAVPAVLLLSLTACGGDDADDAPESASKEEFCEAYNAEPADDDFDPEASPEDQAKAIIDALKEATDKLADVGTPEDIPDDAREGFEVVINAVDGLDEEEVAKAIEEEDEEYFDSIVSGDDKEKGDAFEEWATGYCGDAGSTDGSGGASDDSTE